MIHNKLYKTRFTEIGFTLNSPGDWRFVDLSDAQDGNKDHMHCIGASYATKAELLASVERYAAEYGCDGANWLTPPAETLAQIAKQYLSIPTLETRLSDSLDFYDLNVTAIRYALEAAWKAGKSNS
jgi:hypothetical protein